MRQGGTTHRIYSVVVFVILASLDNVAIGLVPPLYGSIGDASSRPNGNGLALWFEIEDFDAAVRRADALGAEVVLPPHRNPPDGPGGPAHRELWLRDPDGYLVVLASPDGESPWPDPRVV